MDEAPLLVVVTGAPGTGKSTLARAVADALGMPVVSRDEMKEGYVFGRDLPPPSPGDAATTHATQTFFAAVTLLLSRGVSLVADAAFREDVWAPHLEQWSRLAAVRVLVCDAEASTARLRIAQRAERDPTRRRAHADAAFLREPQTITRPSFSSFPHISIDTTDGCRPSLEDVVAYVTE